MVRKDLRRSRPYGYPRSRLLQARKVGPERVELRLERDVLTIEAHRLGHHRVPRQPAHAVHYRQEQVIEDELRSPNQQGEHGHHSDQPFANVKMEALIVLSDRYVLAVDLPLLEYCTPRWLKRSWRMGGNPTIEGAVGASIELPILMGQKINQEGWPKHGW